MKQFWEQVWAGLRSGMLFGAASIPVALLLVLVIWLAGGFK